MRALILIVILGLYSCKKCRECQTIYSQTVSGQTTTSSTSEELCGDDLKEADGRVVESTATVNGYTATIRAVTTCQ